MNDMKNKKYYNDVKIVANQELNWGVLKNRTILICGARGMIGQFLIDVLMLRNNIFKDNISIVALGRSREYEIKKFKEYSESKNFKYVDHDITKPCNLEENIKLDYIINAASNTHPLEYSYDPIGTVMTNVLGTNNLLELAVNKKATRFVLLSSVEIYGENRGDVEEFSEEYCGYIDCNKLRAGYTEGKRVSEALCQAYRKAKSVDCVMVRLARTFGPTMNMDDSKAVSQFIKNALHKEDIILKSQGNQLFSYCYVGDAVSGILKVMTEGEDGEVYNISGKNSNITLKNLALYIAELYGKSVKTEEAGEEEIIGYSKATKAILSIEKMKKLNWYPVFDMKKSLKNTVDILRCYEMQNI